MTHTVHMSHPIRTGTARRLGLRPPPPQGFLICGRELSDEEMARLKDAADRWVGKPSGRYEVQRIPAPAHRRRWWQRRNR